MPNADPICPLCERPIPRAARQSVHHLVPKLKGGAKGPTVLLHQICHSTIHKHLTESDLARRYCTIEALRAHAEIAKFVRWVSNKPPTFHARTAGMPRRR
ncbi:MAG: HNH endonuclease [Pseudomonadota bacterium]